MYAYRISEKPCGPPLLRLPVAGPVRAIPVAAFRKRNHGTERREPQNAQRRRQDRDDGHLDFLLLDLLADVFRRAADHQAADEDGDDRIDQHAVEAGAHSAEDHFVGLDVEQRNETADAA